MRNRKRVSTKPSKNSWPVAYRWLATGTLVAYTAVGCQRVAAAPLPPHPTLGAVLRGRKPLQTAPKIS